jgi:3-deoxy-7-phosphoheptulonate synthase
MRGVARTVIGAIGDERTHASLEPLSTWPQVESVTPIQKRYKLVSREAHPTDSTVTARGVVIGGRKIPGHGRPLLGGKRGPAPPHGRGGQGSRRHHPPRRRLQAAHLALRIPGARRERPQTPRQGPPRNRPARSITELLSENHADLVAEYADILQIGTRNAQNFQLLIAAAKTGKPVLLKRGMSDAHRGMAARRRVHPRQQQSRTPLLRTRHSHLRELHPQHARPLDHPHPQTGDPPARSSSTPARAPARPALVTAMCKGAIAMGADALLIEVHPNPAEAWSDGAQQVTLDGFKSSWRKSGPSSPPPDANNPRAWAGDPAGDLRAPRSPPRPTARSARRTVPASASCRRPSAVIANVDEPLPDIRVPKRSLVAEEILEEPEERVLGQNRSLEGVVEQSAGVGRRCPPARRRSTPRPRPVRCRSPPRDSRQGPGTPKASKRRTPDAPAPGRSPQRGKRRPGPPPGRPRPVASAGPS